MATEQNKLQLPTIKDFDFLKTISRGGYGRVYLAAKKNDESKRKFAIKVINKQHIRKKNLIDQILNERDALAIMNSQFIVRLFYSLQSKENIYLVMEYMIGGDLMSLLCIKQRLELHEAQFYVAEMAMALDYLHRKGVIHGDLKPDNVLISATGHVKLTDLGLSEIRNRRKVSVADVIGTPSVCKVRVFRTPGQIISLTSDFSFSSISDSDSDPSHASISIDNIYANNNFHRSCPSSRLIDSSLRVHRQFLPSCIPENESLSFRNDEFDDQDDANANNTSNFLFSSPSKQPLNISQTIKQRSRIYQKPLSKLLASSPAYQNQSRLIRSTSRATIPLATSVTSSGSPCLSPIRYTTHDTSQVNSISVLVEETKSNQISLTMDDSSLKPICRAINYSAGRILNDITTNTSIRSSFLKSPIHPNVSGHVLGTPDYLSPEILMQDENHTVAVDFWALGICLYQFLVGVTPFSDDYPHAIISNILNYRLVWPEDDNEQLPDDVVHTIKGLLSYDPTVRFQLEGLKVFYTIDWDNLANAPAPFIPVPDNDSDTFYFEARNKAIGFDELSMDNISM